MDTSNDSYWMTSERTIFRTEKNVNITNLITTRCYIPKPEFVTQLIDTTSEPHSNRLGPEHFQNELEQSASLKPHNDAAHSKRLYIQNDHVHSKSINARTDVEGTNIDLHSLWNRNYSHDVPCIVGCECNFAPNIYF